MPGPGWTIAQVAQTLRVSEKTVRRRIERGDLPAFRVPRGRGYEWRVDPAGLGPVGEAAPGLPARPGAPIEDPAECAVRSLLDLLREKDQQILELASQLGAWQERARLLEDELRGQAADSTPAIRRSWVRRLLG